MNVHDLALTIPCAFCGAAPGDHCRIKSGGATDPHETRCLPLARAYRTGYESALRDVANDPDWWASVRHLYTDKETP